MFDIVKYPWPYNSEELVEEQREVPGFIVVICAVNISPIEGPSFDDLYVCHVVFGPEDSWGTEGGEDYHGASSGGAVEFRKLCQNGTRGVFEKRFPFYLEEGERDRLAKY